MLTIVTGNTDKYRQIAQHLPGIETTQRDLDIPEIQTNLLTEISYDKCLQAYVEVQWAVLVDDSGIYFNVFSEFPWALSKFLYQWIWLQGMQRLYEWVSDRWAVFQCVLSYMSPDLPEPVQFVWETRWSLDFSLLWEMEANPKMPYDLIFVPEWMSQPAITDMKLWKSEYNHRTKATKKLADRFTQK